MERNRIKRNCIIKDIIDKRLIMIIINDDKIKHSINSFKKLNKYLNSYIIL